MSEKIETPTFEMPTYILDTSVVVKWFEESSELHIKKAKRILIELQDGKINVLIPNILALELLNAILVGKKSSLEYAELAVQKIYQIPITIVETSLTLLEKAAKLMDEYNLASYDAYFLALAQYEECKLISDDQKAHGQVTDGTVIMLKDY